MSNRAPKLPAPWRPLNRPPRTNRQVLLAWTDIAENYGVDAGRYEAGGYYWTRGNRIATDIFTIDGWCELPAHPLAKGGK